MSDLLAARIQMAMSLGFHIAFAIVGMAMPLMMVIAEWRWLRTGSRVYRTLAQRWAKGTAIFFAVGAVSGTVLSFQLGLLWPRFMEWAAPFIGPLFSFEGIAFFVEAIFLGVYLYGWDKVGPRMHLGAGTIVAGSGVSSAFFVVLANGWMNSPTGYRIEDGYPRFEDMLRAMFNPMGLMEVHHMVLAAYAATGFAVAGIHAWGLLSKPDNLFHRFGFRIAFAVGALAAMAQPISGDILARAVASHQPIKLAAFEALFETQAGAPLLIGGIPDSVERTVSYGVEVPSLLSLLLYLDPNATVRGLEEFPREDWPPIAVVHIAFQLMVACGTIMAAVGLWGAWIWIRHRQFYSTRPFLWCVIGASPLGVVAIEAGWTVTEVGRQPWIIHGVMRTADAVTPMPGLVVPLVLFASVYVVLGLIVIWLLTRHVEASPVITEEERGDAA